MKQIIILLVTVIIASSAYCQTPLQEGDQCFDDGDYTCAIAKYKEAIKLANGKDKQIIEIKLTRVKWCVDHIEAADKEFAKNNYKTAKENYQSVLDSNPKDDHAKTQLDKCNIALTPPATTLSVLKESLSFSSSGGKESITITTNSNSYSVNSVPYWCTVKKYAGYLDVSCAFNSSVTKRNDYFIVTAGDKTVRIYINQDGNVESPVKKEITLSVTTSTLSFSSLGGVSEQIKVYSNASTYSVSLVPSWCSVQTYNGYFVVTCHANTTAQSRSDWFKVTADEKEVRISVNQIGSTYPTAQESSPPLKNSYSSVYYSEPKRCFNCPKTKDTWGITAGYSQLNFGSYANLNGVHLGLKIEPLFKYGFGLNTGLILNAYLKDGASFNNELQFGYFGVNVPVHLEYRFNFSKGFNLFAYGGAGFNLLTNSTFDDNVFPATLEYGGGFRVGHVQFNGGKSSYMGDFKNIGGIGKSLSPFQRLVLSVSYMF